MTKRPQDAGRVDPYFGARTQFSDVMQWLDGDDCPTGHAKLEEDLEERMRELARKLYQGRMDRLFLMERLRVLKGRKPKGEARVRKRELETRFGRVTIRRHGFRAKGCATTFPLDRALRLPAEVYSHGLRRSVSEEVVAQSVERAVERVDATTGGHVPKRQAEQLMVRAATDFGDFYAARERQEPANDQDAAGLLMLSSDSKGVNMLPGALREATRKEAERAERCADHGDPTSTRKDRRHAKRMANVTAIWDQKPLPRTAKDIVTELHGEARTKVRMPRPTRKRIAATVEKTLPQAIIEMFDEADRRDPRNERTTGVVVDGNAHQLATIKAEAERRGRTVTVIVDLLHVLHYLWLAGMAIRRGNIKRANAWMTKYLLRLLTKHPLEIIAGIRQAATIAKLTAEEREPVDTCVKYLHDNLAHIHYADLLARGFPIASGVIEGACRHLVQDRMGITGARWGLASAEAVLRLRALRSNGDWDEYWHFHLEQEELRTRQNLAA